MGNATGAYANGGGEGGGNGNGNGSVGVGVAASNGGVPSLGANYLTNPQRLGPTAPPDYIGSNSSVQNPNLPGSPLLFASPVLTNNGGPMFSNTLWQSEPQMAVDIPDKQGIPTLITWYSGGNDVAVEGSWDNWKSRKKLQRSGKDHCILLVLPAGIYHYKFIVDGETRYIPDLPFITDEMGRVYNLLDVNDCVSENIGGVAEFEPPESPPSSYGHVFLEETDFAKEPVAIPPQLYSATASGKEDTDETVASSSKHVLLNHLYTENGSMSQSVIALGLTHRFQSKYVTVVLYKPLNR